jgi:hypothetical protein
MNEIRVVYEAKTGIAWHDDVAHLMNVHNGKLKS